MTVCIAAMCRDDGDRAPRIVVAADRMVTLGGFMEFEHTVPKVDRPSDTSLAMIAGDTLLGTRLVHNVSQQLRGTTPRISDISAQVATWYETVRQQIAEQMILTPRGLSWTSYYQAQGSLNPNLTMMIDKGLAEFDLGVELLVAGVDDDGAHIYSVNNPGRVDRQHDVIGYAAIGSGAIHAIPALIGFHHSPDDGFKSTVFRVYAAKRRAEAAPGVGDETDVAVITAAAVSWLAPETVDHLRSVYQEFQGNTDSALQQGLNGMNLTGEESTNGTGTANENT